MDNCGSGSMQYFGSGSMELWIRIHEYSGSVSMEHYLSVTTEYSGSRSMNNLYPDPWNTADQDPWNTVDLDPWNTVDPDPWNTVDQDPWNAQDSDPWNTVDQDPWITMDPDYKVLDPVYNGQGASQSRSKHLKETPRCKN